MSEQDPQQAAPDDGATPTPYGATPPPPPPAYGATPPPSYSAPPQPSYSAPQPPYGATPPAYGATPPAYAAAAPLSDAQTRQWAGLAHLGGILWLLPSLIIWLVYKDRSAFVGQEAKKALNFQITLVIASVVLRIADFIFLPWFLVSLVYLGLWVTTIIFSIQGYQAVQRGQAYRYPYSLDLIK